MKLPVFLTLFNFFTAGASRTNSNDSEKALRHDSLPDDVVVERGQGRQGGRRRSLSLVNIRRKVTFHEHQLTPRAARRPDAEESTRSAPPQDSPDTSLQDDNDESHEESPADSDEERENVAMSSPTSTRDSDTESGFTDNDSASFIPRARKKSAFRRCLSKIKRFIFQSGPDSHIEEHIINHRFTPIISGIVIPFSILLEIPGLTEDWYIRTEANHTVDKRPNPTLLDVGLGFSMGCAVIANVALIFRFFEKRVKTTTIVAIIMLSIHDIINTVTLITFGVAHSASDGFTFGQSFWFTLCSTIASLFTNITLIWDFLRTPDFAASGSGLTRKQRSLVIVVMLLLCYLGVGALINSLLIHLAFIDGLYFTVVTIETVGFGDIVPHSTGARIFVVFHSVTCIIILGLAVNITRETVIEGFEHSYRSRMAKLREKRKARKAHRADVHARKKAIKNQLRLAGLPLYVPKHDSHSSHVGGARSQRHSRGMHLNIEGLSPEQLQAAIEEAHREREMETGQNTPVPVIDHDHEEIITLGRTKSEISLQNFENQITDDQQKEFTVKLTVVWTLFLVFWLVGAAIFMKTENWSFGIAIWFCFESFTTIGYGDYYPVTPAGRSIFIVWALLGIGTMTILISVLVEASSSKYNTVISRHDD